MTHLVAWAEHIWCRMRRMDYWAEGWSVTNAPAKMYRAVAPGLGNRIPNVMRKEPDTILNIRYFPRDVKRRDVRARLRRTRSPSTVPPPCAQLSHPGRPRPSQVSYYPDTPLSLNHNLMKGKPQRPNNDPSGTCPIPPAFDLKTAATPATMGVKPSTGLNL